MSGPESIAIVTLIVTCFVLLFWGLYEHVRRVNAYSDNIKLRFFATRNMITYVEQARVNRRLVEKCNTYRGAIQYLLDGWSHKDRMEIIEKFRISDFSEESDSHFTNKLVGEITSYNQKYIDKHSTSPNEKGTVKT